MTRMQPGRPAVEVAGLRKRYGQGETEVRALDGVDLRIEHGDYVAIMGASGSGKSTIMNIIGCLDVGTSGLCRLDGIDVRRLNDRQLSLVRNRKIGFVFQNFNLISRTTAQRNVELPLAYGGVRSAERARRASVALANVGLSDRATHVPSELSGGQQQRVAVARAIVTEPVLLLADEPTGALDSHSTANLLALFDDVAASARTVVVITHEDEVARHAKRIIHMSDGRIVSDARQVDVHAPPPRWHGPDADTASAVQVQVT